MRIVVSFTLWALLGMSCVQIDEMQVTTNAVNCNVARGSSTSSAGEGGASSTAGSGSGTLDRLLSSKITCPGATDSEISR